MASNEIQSPSFKWITYKDRDAVFAIQENSHDFPMTEEEFVQVLSDRSNWGVLIEIGREICGYIIYSIYRKEYTILSMGVVEDRRRAGIGSMLIQHLKEKLISTRRHSINILVPENNLGAQLFMQKHEFKAIAIKKSPYELTNEDGYLMRFATNIVDETWQSQNRITAYLA